ncbi:hypothetical protein [Effusibacillus pohliae]|uniref:hypothetical protein n=1 Tax=Effusibacillus pohliae TaxID=232270 RepID=UPI00037BF323|nr:hypothetical protein [Effusibacillus pohliae]
MKGKFFMSILTFLSVCALALSGSSGLAASTTKTVDAPTAALMRFLKAAENQNFDQMIETSIDTRFDAGTRKKMYTEQFSKSSEQIKKFAIVSQTSKTPSIYRFETTLSFKDGHQANIPFDVINQDGNWKVEQQSHRMVRRAARKNLLTHTAVYRMIFSSFKTVEIA